MVDEEEHVFTPDRVKLRVTAGAFDACKIGDNYSGEIYENHKFVPTAKGVIANKIQFTPEGSSTMRNILVICRSADSDDCSRCEFFHCPLKKGKER